MELVNSEVGQVGERLGAGPGGLPGAQAQAFCSLLGSAMREERPLKSQTTNKTAAGTKAYRAPGVRFYTTKGLSQR